MIEAILSVVFAIGITAWSALVIYLNLYCKDEIWEAIYERMEWNETDIS